MRARLYSANLFRANLFRANVFRASVYALALLLALAGCDKRETSATSASASATASAAKPPAERTKRPLSSPAAFDLTTARDGVVLAWGAPGGSVRVQRIDRSGREVGSAERIEQPFGEVGELVAQAASDRVALAWMATKKQRAVLVSSMVDARTGKADTPVLLGETERRAMGKRGHVALSLRGSDRILALHQGPRGSCREGESAQCSTFSISELPRRDQDPPRPRLVIDTPCERAVVGMVSMNQHWHYALCEMRGSEELTTVFTIRPDPAYAQARELLPGCEPNGMTVVDDELWITATCKGRRSAWRLRGIEAGATALDTSTASVRCEQGQPVIQTAVRGPTHPLLEPRSDVSPLLPSRVAPVDARAVWTGEVLLVARAEGSALALSRYRCRGAMLVQN